MAKKISKKRTTKSARKPPVSIPLDFDAAVGGLVAVNPADVKRPKKRAKRK